MREMRMIRPCSGCARRYSTSAGRFEARSSRFLQDRLEVISPRAVFRLCHHGDTMHIDILEAAETGHQMHSDVQIFDSVIRSRKAVRVFRPDAVSQKDIADILDVARTAPSNSNMQPWRVHVLSGRIKEALSEALMCAHVADLHPPLQHVPDPMPEAYRPMQEAFGSRYYGALGIDKADLAGRA